MGTNFGPIGTVEVIGNLWMPNALAAYAYPLNSHDVENMSGDDGKIARREIEQWLSTHAGDFQSIIDFSASIKDANYGWSDPENEIRFFDMMYGSDE